jgi:hypothetical protein
MDRPGNDQKGAVFIRTKFGEVSQDYFPGLSLADMIEDQAWREAVDAQGGPFCYTDTERPMPF